MITNSIFFSGSRLMHLLTMAVFLLLVMSISPAASAQKAYVSDQLKIPLRTGASNGHRIIKFLRSGTPLTVIDTDGDYTEVETGSGKSGWVLTSEIMDVPSGRARLAVANKKLAEARAQVKELKGTVAELRAEIRSLKNEKDSLQSERTNLSNSLEDLRITAANPVALSKKNKQLKKELEKANANVAMLDKDNQQLRSNVMQEWFVIGGAVAIGSLLLGIILTRINWRRKRDSWGDSF